MQKFRTLRLTLITCASGVALWLWSAHTTAQDRGQRTKRPVSLNAEPRLALVIGNAAYKEAPLTNPLNDARDMEAVLRSVGFEVLSGIDRNQRQMKELIRQFGLKLRNGGVGLFYFAGHGVQVGGRNYLIPIGAEINSESEVEYEAVEAGFVLAQMEEARNRLNVVILDACRNNPFARGFRSGTRGLAGMRSAPSGTLIAYATAADDVAADGNRRNGLFTGELLAQIKTPGLTLAQVFQRTRTSVRNKSGGRQVPFEYTSVEGDEDFYFIRPNASPVPAPVVSAEQAAWERAKQRGTVEAVRGFLSLYAGSQFEAEAQAMLATLEKKATPANSSNSPSSATPARPTPTPRPTPLALTPVIALPRDVDPACLTMHRFMTATVDANGKVSKFAGKPKQQYSEDLGNGVRFEMVAVKGAGNIQDFWIGKFEVTQAQWRAVMETNPSTFKGDDLPVENVYGKDAKEFCRRLNYKLGLSEPEDEGYRLPLRAEWQYAACAGAKTEFAFGDRISPEIANYNSSSPSGNAPQGIYRAKTVPVGSLGVANAWGIFDMHGNVWELHEGAQFPGDSGGSWRSEAIGCRSSRRSRPGSESDVGFRLSRTASRR